MRYDRAWLLATAKAVAKELKRRSDGTQLRIRIPTRVMETNTDGWRAVIGTLGKNQAGLQIWYDRITGYAERKLYACFVTRTRQGMRGITKRVGRKLWPVRVVGLEDVTEQKYLFFSTRLKRSEFNLPILEKYPDGYTFYGIYDPTREAAKRISPHFCRRAAAFFEDVSRALPQAAPEDEHRDVYPQCENRKRVASHLVRERSRLLATERKILDNYECQVCRMHFAEVYGKALGADYAEAHHLIALGQLREAVKTRIEDLRTVCSNCHHMLHRMKGIRNDISHLRAVVRRRQGAGA